MQGQKFRENPLHNVDTQEWNDNMDKTTRPQYQQACAQVSQAELCFQNAAMKYEKAGDSADPATRRRALQLKKHCCACGKDRKFVTGKPALVTPEMDESTVPAILKHAAPSISRVRLQAQQAAPAKVELWAWLKKLNQWIDKTNKKISGEVAQVTQWTKNVAKTVEKKTNDDLKKLDTVAKALKKGLEELNAAEQRKQLYDAALPTGIQVQQCGTYHAVNKFQGIPACGVTNANVSKPLPTPH